MERLIELSKEIFHNRIFRYGISGGATFLVNVIAVWVLIDWTPLGATIPGRNASHFLGAVVSILFSYFAHRIFTWSDRAHLGKKPIAQAFQYYVFTGFTLAFRQISFYTLDGNGIHWFFSTVIPLILVIIMNFIGYDKLIFGAKKAS